MRLLSTLIPATTLLFLASAPVLAQPTATNIEVRLSNFAFTPSTIPLVAGHSYVLHLVNDAGGGHNFVARDFFAKANVLPADRSKIGAKGVVEIAGHQSVDIRLTAPAVGTYAVHCSHFLHQSFGMKGMIVVATA